MSIFGGSVQTACRVRDFLLVGARKIANDQGDVSALLVGQSRNVQHGAHRAPQERVGRHAENVRHAHQHLNGGKYVVVFPVGYALLGYAEQFGKGHLIHSLRLPQLFDIFVQ